MQSDSNRYQHDDKGPSSGHGHGPKISSKSKDSHTLTENEARTETSKSNEETHETKGLDTNTAKSSKFQVGVGSEQDEQKASRSGNYENPVSYVHQWVLDNFQDPNNNWTCDATKVSPSTITGNEASSLLTQSAVCAEVIKNISSYAFTKNDLLIPELERQIKRFIVDYARATKSSKMKRQGLVRKVEKRFAEAFQISIVSG
jgi:hypothetical protein